MDAEDEEDDNANKNISHLLTLSNQSLFLKTLLVSMPKLPRKNGLPVIKNKIYKIVASFMLSFFVGMN
jgi:hypothetical protein